MPQPSSKTSARLVEILDQGRLRPGLIVREQGDRVAVLGADGREKLISRITVAVTAALVFVLLMIVLIPFIT